MNKEKIYIFVVSILFPILLLLTTWEICSYFNLIQAIFISSPAKVFNAFIVLFSTGSILIHLQTSLLTLLGGLFCAISLGIPAGIIIGYFEKIYIFSKVYIYLLNALPLVAIIPLILIWLGIGFSSKIFVVFLLSVTPILINTLDGVHSANKKRLMMAKTFNASNLFILKTITIYEAIPFIFSGLKLAIGRSIAGVIIAELFGYGKGLGYLITYYGGTFQTANLIAIIIIILTISLFGIFLISFLEKNVVYWKS